MSEPPWFCWTFSAVSFFIREQAACLQLLAGHSFPGSSQWWIVMRKWKRKQTPFSPSCLWSERFVTEKLKRALVGPFLCWLLPGQQPPGRIQDRHFLLQVWFWLSGHADCLILIGSTDAYHVCACSLRCPLCCLRGGERKACKPHTPLTLSPTLSLYLDCYLKPHWYILQVN